MPRPNENWPLRVDPRRGFVPRVSRVADSSDRVYWGPGQPLQQAEPPGYSPPVDWPPENNTFVPPLCVRVWVVEADGIDVSGDGCRAMTRSFVPVEGVNELAFNYCTCNPNELITVIVSGEEITAPATSITDTFINAEMNARGHPGIFYTEFEDADIGNCEDNGFEGGTDPAAAARQQEWEDAEAAARAALAGDGIDLVFGTVDATNYLTWVSVGEGFVPLNPPDRPFVSGRTIHMVAFIDDRALDEYDPGTVRSDPAGSRVWRARPAFQQERAVLVGDGVTGTFQTELREIAEALSDGEVVYRDRSPDTPVEVILGEARRFFTT